ncbi:putative periplasmic lipoprotein [Beggiatoa alba B18LD]|uniref:Putative periplasmic lipoprotein n=1 Tax=Beggiatoa alba B18LD TaxID=395493 RepID=I3CJ12_9GAMM|nr:imelysin family protein [Beggiatoa alba]EIJ43605.1 putative periplasmic lipoprotein [Beggiatoa alba B18LD]
MLKKTLSILSLCLSTNIAIAKDIPAPPEQLFTDITQQVVLPAYQAFIDQAQQLQQQANTFCTNASDAQQLTATQQAFHATLNAWMKTQAIRFGAVKQHNTDSKIQFFPDRKDTVKLKVTTLLASATPLTQTDIEKQGSTALGLSALEILLFEPAEQTLNAFTDKQRCTYLTLATSTLLQDGNTLFNQAKEAEKPNLTTLIASLIEITEIMKDSKLGAPLGKKTNGMVKPFFAENWRSHASLNNLQANLEGLQQLYTAGKGYGIDDYLQSLKHNELDTEIQQQIQSTIDVIQTIKLPLNDTLTVKSEERAKLERLFFELDILTRLIKTNLTEALQITTGFNSLDGD